MKYIASLSGGKDSVAMILLLLEKNYPLDEVIYFNTGWDFKAIEEVIEKMKGVLDKANVKFTELKHTVDFDYLMLEKPVNKRDGTRQFGYGWCGGTCRWGTGIKTDAIRKYLKSLNDVTVEYIGIAGDEQKRITHDYNSIKIYPLAEWQMSEKDCLNYCYQKGFFWHEGETKLYDVLNRVSCWCCRNKNLKELESMYNKLPEYWERLRVLQEKIPMPMKDEKTVFDLEKRFENNKKQLVLF